MRFFWDCSVEVLWLRDREGKEGRRRGAEGKDENGDMERGKRKRRRRMPMQNLKMYIMQRHCIHKNFKRKMKEINMHRRDRKIQKKGRTRKSNRSR